MQHMVSRANVCEHILDVICAIELLTTFIIVTISSCSHYYSILVALNLPFCDVCVSNSDQPINTVASTSSKFISGRTSQHCISLLHNAVASEFSIHKRHI